MKHQINKNSLDQVSVIGMSSVPHPPWTPNSKTFLQFLSVLQIRGVWCHSTCCVPSDPCRVTLKISWSHSFSYLLLASQCSLIGLLTWTVLLEKLPRLFVVCWEVQLAWHSRAFAFYPQGDTSSLACAILLQKLSLRSNGSAHSSQPTLLMPVQFAFWLTSVFFSACCATLPVSQDSASLTVSSLAAKATSSVLLQWSCHFRIAFDSSFLSWNVI